MATKILVIDDDLNICDLLRMYLENEGYEVKTANDGEEGLNSFKTFEPDLVLLDLMLPKKDGNQVCREIREISSKPIIMLTAKSDVSDKISGLNSGADDYLAKPFNSDELVARIYAITRRKGDYVGTRISYGDLTLDCETHALSCGEQTVKLGTKEFQILEMLLKNPQRVFPKELIIEKIWGYDSEAEYNNVEVYVSFIRRKLTALKSAVALKSIRNTGYTVEVEE